MTTTVAVPRPHDKVEADQIRPMRCADLEATERTCGHVLVDDASQRDPPLPACRVHAALRRFRFTTEE